MIRSMLLISTWRFHRRHWIQMTLSIAGITLGVAVFVGVDVSNTSANAAFESSAEFVRGATTHRLLSLGDSLDERWFVDLVAARGLTGAPIIDAAVRIPGTGARAKLLGVDPIEEAAFRDATRLGLLGGSASETLITVPSTAVVSGALLSPASSDSLSIRTGSGAHTLQVAGTLPREAGVADMIVTDISTAQEIMGMIGRLTRIDLILNSDQESWLRENLPRGTALVTAGNENQAFEELSKAFRINILALGLLALAVGMLLVYSSANFALVQRAHAFGILRTLGINRRELALSILQEFLLLGLIASLIGVVLGHALAGALIDLMLSTISDFSFRGNVAVDAAGGWLYAKGVVIGIAATLLAAIGPILHATQRDAHAALRRSALEARSQERTAAGVWASLLLSLIGAVLLAWPSRSLIVAFAGLFAVLAAAACAAPALAKLLVSGFSRLARRLPGFITLQASRNVLAQQSRIAVAGAALMLAVACVIGVGVMIDSFRSSLQSWLDTTLTSDIYVNLSGNAALANALISFIESDQRVEDFSLTRFASLPSAWGTLSIRAFQPAERGWGIQVIAGDVESATSRLESGSGIAITEPFALRSGLTAGDQLRLPGDVGEHSFEIVAVYRDYDAGGAAVLMALSQFRQLWRDDSVDGIGIEVAAAADVSAVETDIARQLPQGAARITTATGIRRISLEIFDRT
ncbi:MAG: FtsX-like permease family protein, partial [Gammaproteobacteria bacterium]